MRKMWRSWWGLGRAMCLVAAVYNATVAGQETAGQWQRPAAELARQIAAITGPGAVSLSVRNVSSIGADDVARIEGAVVKELTGAGVQVRTGVDVSNTVRVTLSQSARQGLWVGEVQQGPEVRVAMVAAALPQTTATAQNTEVVLHRKLLLARAEPVLDTEWASTGQPAGTGTLVVLGPDDVSFYARSAGTGGGQEALAKTASFAVQHELPFPRDVRGKLDASDAGWKAYLPGVMCVSAGSSEGQVSKSVTCSESDDPWPLQGRQALFNAGRNFFTGVTVPALPGDATPFYAEADLSGIRGGLSVVSLVSGGFRALDGATARPLSGARDWGSDIAALRSGCGSGAQVLTSAAGDARQDALTAYEIDRAQAIPASAPLPFGGRVTAMWAAEDHGAAAVVVVVEKTEPQMYEVYRVTATCGS